MVHGGPQSAWLDGWSYRWNPPLWAAQGYVVITPNPRGSTGFGQKFTDDISRDWGGKVFTDLMDGVDYAAALPYVDGNRMAAAGASFGGYMMNWFLGNAGTRFKAIISHDGSYNFESNYGMTDELWFDEWEHGGTPWTNPDGFTANSPHKFARNFRTPTLVIHGALDFRVPESEGMQLFTALQRQGVPSEFPVFSGRGTLGAEAGQQRALAPHGFWLALTLRREMIAPLHMRVGSAKVSLLCGDITEQDTGGHCERGKFRAPGGRGR
jgi:dipeptidyl aminopeptidase/acylaminoacyl peptidase